MTTSPGASPTAATGGPAWSRTSTDVEAQRLPLYHRLELVLREQIRSGEVGLGALLPTEAQLAESYGISRITVRQALASLERNELVQRVRGKGTFVKHAGPEARSLELTGSIEELITVGARTRARVLEFRAGRPPRDVADALALDPRAAALLIRRVRFTASEPLAYVVAWVPADLGKHLTRDRLETTPVLKLLQGRAGLVLGEARQAIRASLADAVCAELLGVPVGAPLLTIERTVFTREGRPVEHVRGYYRGDRYTYMAKLTSDQGDRPSAGTAPGRSRGTGHNRTKGAHP